MDQTNPASPEPEAGQQPRDESSLDSLSQRLEGLARQLDEVADQPEEAASLVREASDLAAEAGREVEAALKAASEAREE
jgi:hypothetical protein